jgi:hypothetical protein
MQIAQLSSDLCDRQTSSKQAITPAAKGSRLPTVGPPGSPMLGPGSSETTCVPPAVKVTGEASGTPAGPVNDFPATPNLDQSQTHTALPQQLRRLDSDDSALRL